MNPSNSNPVSTPFSSPLYLMLKPIGSICNLHCNYCYYLDKKKLYSEDKNFMMSDELLEEFVEQYINSQTMQQVLFTWHGGEPLMRNISFYKKALELQCKYARGKQVDNCIQTNGTLLNDTWCKFFKENNFLVGISIDGTQRLHDKYRRTKDGRPSFHEVMKGIALLKKHGVDFNVMGVVNNYNVDYPLEFYNFFKQIDCRYIQFSPVVEKVNGKLASWNVPADKWGNFLIAIFDEWVKKDVGEFFIQHFDATLANWVGQQPGICIFSETCGRAGVMEFNGDVYSCDHFVFSEYKLGNIRQQTITEMMLSERQLKFGNEKRSHLTDVCLRCNYLNLCNGECPKNRIVSIEGEKHLQNYLCKGLRHYFLHTEPYFKFMANELAQNRAPANVMSLFA